MEKVEFYSSKQVKQELKIQDCDLAHIRNSGKLSFVKKGNAFLYLKQSVEDYKELAGSGNQKH